MLQDYAELIRQGDSSGNGMLIRLTLSSGQEIVGIPTENTYGGGWDLGPTWNYVVLDEKPFLVDTGRVGSAAFFLTQSLGVRDGKLGRYPCIQRKCSVLTLKDW